MYILGSRHPNGNFDHGKGRIVNDVTVLKPTVALLHNAWKSAVFAF